MLSFGRLGRLRLPVADWLKRLSLQVTMQAASSFTFGFVARLQNATTVVAVLIDVALEILRGSGARSWRPEQPRRLQLRQESPRPTPERNGSKQTRRTSEGHGAQ